MKLLLWLLALGFAAFLVAWLLFIVIFAWIGAGARPARIEHDARLLRRTLVLLLLFWIVVVVAIWRCGR